MTPRTRRARARPAGGAGAGAPLLATKLYIPQARPDLVARPRLLARLEV